MILPARYEPDHPQRHPYDWRTKTGQVLWPQKFTDSVLKTLWANLGGADGYAVAGQQQQRPQPREGGLFKRQWFKMLEAIPNGVIWVRAWDFAGTEDTGSNDPDYTVGCKIGYHPPSKTYIIGHIIRERLDPGGVDELIRRTAEQDGHNVAIFIPQDPGSSGKNDVKYKVSQLAGYTVKFEPMSGSKAVRAMPLAAQASVGNVSLYRADWNEPFFEEVCAFPNGMHDDQVDAVACGFSMFISKTTGLLEFFKEQANDRAEAEAALRQAMGIQRLEDYQWIR